MPITKTLLQVRNSAVYELGSAPVGSGSTFRHDTTQVNEEINSAYAEYRELLVERNFTLFLTEGSLTTLPTSPASTGEQYSLVDMPSTAIVVKRVDTIVNNEWKSLTEIDWAAIRTVVPRSNQPSVPRPTHFAVRDIGSVATVTLTAGKIALLPMHTGTGSYKLSYLERWTPITDDTHLFLFPNEAGFRWVVWTVVARMSVRDRDKGKRFTMSERERIRLEDRIGRFTPKVVASTGASVHRSRDYWS